MKPTLFQIQEAIRKNVCPPDDTEAKDLTTSRTIQTSTKREGDSQLGMLIFVGLAMDFGYKFPEISVIASLEKEEFQYKHSKFKNKLKSKDERFKNKLKLIKNYLRIKYGAA